MTDTQTMCLNSPKIRKNCENLIRSSVHAIYCRKAILAESYVCDKSNVQRTIVNRHLSNIFKVRKSISAKNPGVHFALNISANQDLELMLIETQLAGYLNHSSVMFTTGSIQQEARLLFLFLHFKPSIIYFKC